MREADPKAQRGRLRAQRACADIGRSRFALRAIAVLAAALAAAPPAAANGGKAKQLFLIGESPNASFETTIDPILFAATSLRGKYKVMRIRITTRSDRTLALSAKRDRVLVAAGDRSVAAILDLATADPVVWDGLPQQVREAAAYPAVVEAGEEQSVVVFVPVGTLESTPDHVTYSVASEPQAIELRAPMAAAERSAGSAGKQS